MGDLRPTIMGLGFSMPILACITVALRYHSRVIKRIRLEADDYTILVGLIFAIGFAIDVMIDCRLGDLGGHESYTSEGIPIVGKSYIIFQKSNYAAQMLWYPCVGVTKISILLFYKRIFVGRRFRVLVWSMITFTCLWMTSFLIAHLVQCIPISGLWATTPGKYDCVNTKALYTAGSVTDILTDVAILALPIYNVWKLQMPTARKIGVCSIFLLGTLVIVTGIVRLIYVVEAFSALPTERTADGTYIFAPAIFWTMIETSLGVVSACLPTLRPLYGAYSLNSVVNSIRSMISGRPLKESNGSAVGHRLHSSDGDSSAESKSSFRYHQATDPYYNKTGLNGQRLPDNPYVFSAEGMHMDDLLKPASGIMVKNDISSRHDDLM